LAQIRVFNPSYTPRSYFAGGEDERGGKSTMAKHRHHRRHHRRNPFGISTGVVKDAAFNAGGAIASLYIAKFAGQTGWLDVGATVAAAVAASYAGKFVGGASASDEILKGGLTAAIIKALGQAGVPGVPSLGLYVNSFFSAPSTSDAYGRATAPTVMLPAPSGMKGLGYQRYRSRYQTRF
jgi:hypothetical protein